MMPGNDCAPAQPLEILLVEDNPADVRMTREALAATRVAHRLHVVEDGESALAYLRREGGFECAPRPDIMLLDLSLPRMNGHEVLSVLRERRRASRFPVVVLTGSRRRTDLERSFELEADEFITKPPTLLGLSAELMFALNLARRRPS
jgi:CheY-like chemotaxis protein